MKKNRKNHSRPKKTEKKKQKKMIQIKRNSSVVVIAVSIDG
jgi:hypothetical protein